MDVLVFVLLLTVYIWLVLPWSAAKPSVNTAFTLAAIALAVISMWWKGVTRKQSGLRLDNLPAALAAYLGCSAAYAGAVLLLYRNSLVVPVLPAATGSSLYYRIGWPLLWAFLQQLCLLSFLFNRLRRILGREVPAILATAGLFAFFHVPNPFLILYTLGGGLLAAFLFRRWPNLPAASLAHALASALVGGFLPREVTGWMRVGPLYWWVK